MIRGTNMRASWGLLAVLAMASLAVQATDLEDKVSTVIEQFRHVMKDGNSEPKIPVLDPLSIPQLPLNIKVSPFNAKVVASNIAAAGASAFRITQIKQVTGTNKLAVSLEVPSVDVSGSYVIDGQVKVGFFNVNLKGNGPLAVALRNLKGDGIADVIVNADGTLNVNNIEINSWNFDSLKVELNNLFNGGVMGKTVNKLINKLVPTFIKANRAKINMLAETLGTLYINRYLDGMAGKKTLTAIGTRALEAESWTVSAEMQEMLDQLALMAVAAPAAGMRDTSDNIVTTINDLSEVFREEMKKGRTDIGIPVMDPAAVQQISIDINRWTLSGKVTTKNVQVVGASSYELTQITPVADSDKVVVAFRVPSIVATGDYDVESKFGIGFLKTNINRQGTSKLTINNLNAVANAAVTKESDGSLTLTSLEIESWGYDSINLDLDNLVNGNFFQRTINSLINKLSPALIVKPNMDRVARWAGNRGARVIGRFLDELAGRVAIPDLDQKAGKLLDELKTVMKEGSTAYDMPKLDPATLEEVPVTFQSTLIDANIDGKEIQVAGAANYVVTKITRTAGTNDLSVEVQVDEINADGKFDVTGTLNVFLKKIPFEDHGSLTAVIKGLKAAATVTLADNLDGSLKIRSLQIDSWSTDSIKVEFAKLANGGRVGKLLNSAINVVLPQIVKAERAKITTWAETVVRTVLDQYLAGVAAQSAAPVTVHLTTIPAESLSVLKQLAAVAFRAGLANAA